MLEIDYAVIVGQGVCMGKRVKNPGNIHRAYGGWDVGGGIHVIAGKI